MGTDLHLEIGTLYSFLLVLARISGAFVFVPLPGIKTGPDLARVILSLGMTFVLFPSWPKINPGDVNIALLTGWLLAEAGIGIAVGLAVAFLAEGFQMGAQIISLQAGYTFATTIDPTSGADSSVLLSLAQLTSGLLFFATGLDYQVLLAFAHSISTHPPGHLAISPSVVDGMIDLGASVFTTGLRLVLPLLGLLLMVEISLALLARLNSQLQIMMLAFPIKMLLSLTLMAWLMLVFPKVFSQTSHQVLQVIRALLA